MRLRLIACGIVLGAVGALATSEVLSQGGAEADPAEMERMMKLWQEIATPGDAHAALEFFAGDWDSTTRVWMGGPSNPPTETKGSVSSEWILSGHFLKSTSTGEMMGMPVHGMGVMGYDNYKKKYTQFWIDSANTAMYHAEGLVDQTGKVFTLFGSMDEWMTGEHDKTVKYVYRIVSDDSFIFEIHDLGIVPGETRVIEMEYTRRK